MKLFFASISQSALSERFRRARARLIRDKAMSALTVGVLAFAAIAARGAEPSKQAAKSTAAAGVPAGKADNGKRLFTSYGCYECHGHMAEGGAAGLRLAPDPIAFEALVKYVRHPTGQMPPYTGKVVSDSDLADIYAFLQSVPPQPKPENIPLLK